MNSHASRALLLAIALAIRAPRPAEAAAALQMELGTNPLVAPSPELVFGWEFIVNVPIRINHFGVFDAGGDGLARLWAVKIWEASDQGFTPTKGEINDGVLAVDGFRYVETIAQLEPFLNGPYLEPGRYIIVAGGLDFGDVDLMPSQAASITTDPAITFVQARSAMNTDHDEDLVFPGTSEPGVLKYFGPNFQFDVVPEPSILTVGGIGFAMLWRGRRRRQ